MPAFTHTMKHEPTLSDLQRHPGRWVLTQFGGVAVLLTLTLGCGKGADVQRFPVSGRVTFDGKPVPAGRIQFEPDATQGNRGPAGYAVIRDGQYDTSDQGKGSIGGPHRVVIVGFDGKRDLSAELPHGRRLFPNYRTAVDLPHEKTNLDFDVRVESHP